VVQNVADNDPQLAADTFGDLLSEEGGGLPGSEAAPAANRIAGALAQWDPAGAAVWAAGLPSDLARDAVASVVANWAGNDPVAASGWLADLPAGDLRDAATTHLVSAIRDHDPEGAFAWAASVGDGNQRASLIADVARRWAELDEAAAVEAVLASDLNDEQKANVLGGFE
jgi:hypothetical protein